MKKNFFNFIILLVVSIGIFTTYSFKSKKALKNAKVSSFILCHQEATILKSSSYTTLNKLTDDQLKKACTNPTDGDYVTVKLGTFNLRDGNTRIYILKKRGYGDFVIPFDEADTGAVCDF